MTDTNWKAIGLGVLGISALIGVGIFISRRSKGLAGHREDVDMAELSLREEEKAIHDYGQRAHEAADPKLMRLFQHTRQEEETHARHLRRWLKR